MLILVSIFLASFFSFHFPSASVLFFFAPSLPFVLVLFLVLFFGCTYNMYHGYVPGDTLLQVIRHGIPQLVLVQFPLRIGTVVHVIFCVFSSIEALFCSTFGYISGK